MTHYPHFTDKRTEVQTLNFSVVLQLTKRWDLDLNLTVHVSNHASVQPWLLPWGPRRCLAFARLHSTFMERGRRGYPRVAEEERTELLRQPRGEGIEAELARLLTCDPNGLRDGNCCGRKPLA